MIRRYLIFTLVISGGVILAASVHQPGVRAAHDDQPVSSLKFSHKFHAAQGVDDCATCHPAAETSKFSSDNLSSTHQECSSCHEEQVDNTCGYCHADPENIQAIPTLAREVRFSHEQHTAMEDVECATCHKGVIDADVITAANMPDMATCNTCHNDRKASNTCESCHTDFVTLIPADHKMSDFRRNHRDVVRLGALNTTCQTCHTETFCQQCHQPTELKSFQRRDLVSEPDGKRSTKDSPNQMTLQNVHELNYRFTHGIDAKSRRMECQSCHEVQTFCAECHSAGGNINQARFKPASHGLPGFTTLGAGSGGGLHAEEARRDIESCATCHDVEGRDPTCFTCHTEDGIIR